MITSNHYRQLTIIINSHAMFFRKKFFLILLLLMINPITLSYGMEEKKVNNQNNENDDRRQNDAPENPGDHDPENIPGDNGNAQGMTDNDPNDANSKASGKEEKPTTKAHQKTEDYTYYDFTKLRLRDFRILAFLDHIPNEQPFLLYYKGENLTYHRIERAADLLPENKKCLNAFITLLKKTYSDKIVDQNRSFSK